MRISELRNHLAYLEANFGDLDCVVYGDHGIFPIKAPRIHILQDYDFGRLSDYRTGDKVAVIWSKHS